MNTNLKQHFEKLFRESTSSDDLFDAFRNAIEKKVKDGELYKILLGNAALSPYEIKMFTEKLCEEFRDLSFDLYMWTGNVLENCNAKDAIEMSLEYYKKAINADNLNYLPYFSLVKIFDPEINIPTQEELLQILKTGLDKVKLKSKIYLALAELYNKLNNLQLKQMYIGLASKTARNENNL